MLKFLCQPNHYYRAKSLLLIFAFDTKERPLTDCFVEAEIFDSKSGSIGRRGRMTIGYIPGVATVRIKFGKKFNDLKEFIFEVGDDRVEPKEGTGGKGGDIPEILLCGEEAPGKENYPAELRTMPGGPEYPTIIEDPQFEGIVWINPKSKEAIRIRRGVGGSSGLGRIGNKTFLNFVALKCFEILKRLYVRQQIAGDRVTEFEFMQHAVNAEIECSDFIDAAWEMMDGLLKRKELTDEG